MATGGPHAEVRLVLPGGDVVVLVDMLGRDGGHEEVNRNVYRITPNGEVVWQIQAGALDGERQPFTNISLTDSNGLKAFNWNGVEYPVELKTGELGKGVLVR